jgi:hypothetical protein
MSLIHSGSCDGTTQVSESMYICAETDYRILSISGLQSGSLLKIISTHEGYDDEKDDFVTGSFCPNCEVFWIANEVSGSYF